MNNLIEKYKNKLNKLEVKRLELISLYMSIDDIQYVLELMKDIDEVLVSIILVEEFIEDLERNLIGCLTMKEEG